MAGHLSALIDFMYYGEVWIPKDDLDEFLCVAKELDIKGLDGQPKVKEEECKSFNLLPKSKGKYLFQDYIQELLKVMIF